MNDFVPCKMTFSKVKVHDFGRDSVLARLDLGFNCETMTRSHLNYLIDNGLYHQAYAVFMQFCQCKKSKLLCTNAHHSKKLQYAKYISPDMNSEQDFLTLLTIPAAPALHKQ